MLHHFHEAFKFLTNEPLADAADAGDCEPSVHFQRLTKVHPTLVHREIEKNEVPRETWVCFKKAADIIWPPS
jgi:hypothetical protein